MTKISADILSQMMDAFASIISNNLNDVMKILAVATIILSIPTVLGSLYGMNVLLPGQDSPFTFAVIVLISLGASAALMFYSWKETGCRFPNPAATVQDRRQSTVNMRPNQPFEGETMQKSWYPAIAGLVVFLLAAVVLLILIGGFDVAAVVFSVVLGCVAAYVAFWVLNWIAIEQAQRPAVPAAEAK